MNRQLLDDVTKAMKECEQAPGLTILQHGELVYAKAVKLLAWLDTSGMKIPYWFEQNYGELLKHVYHHFDDFKTYCTYHDCGKPFCLRTDAEGKRHFDDHAVVSHKIWSGIDGDPLSYISQCILHDMDFHRLGAHPVELTAFAALPFAPSLLVSGLAEIHANAELCGGIESEGFKRKYAHIERRGKAVCKLLYENRRLYETTF